MAQYFIGIIPPLHIYDEVIKVQKKYIKKLGVEPHITLKAQSCLTDDEQWIITVENIVRSTPKFNVKLSGTAYFGDIVLYLSIDSEEHNHLHKNIVRELYVPKDEKQKYFEDENYVGHITIGKTTYPSGLSSNQLSVDDLRNMEKEINSNIKIKSFKVDSVWIYKKEENEYMRYKKINLK
ncbi:2'-5' RNA ligase family protein [Macrococcus animalis]|uniref:2'-5' RNA ligase family protein n=1 Tax=Macrococcus animalis TaxID=3395467 RepID=UPI0039BE0477